MSTIIEPNAPPEPGRGPLVLEPSAPPRRKSIWWKIGSVVLSVVKWLLIGILALLSAVLVGIPLTWGPTPFFVSLLLVAAWVAIVALLVLGTARFPYWRVYVGAALGFVLLGLLSVMISQVTAYTPAIVDANGKPLPGSIATLEKIRLGGSDEWISIRGKNISNPVLLFLAGGPGGSQLTAEPFHLAALEDHFVVVNWEQPGSGKSFDAVDRSKMTVDKYITDGHELVLYLNKRFGTDKVYVMGESWGSALGIMLVQRYPQLFYAFIGTGQMVDFTQCDLIDYNLAIQWAQERGDTAKVNQLKAQGPPPYYGNDVGWKEANYLMDGFAHMNEDPNIYESSGNTFSDLLSPEYGLYDKVNWLRGPLDTLNHVYPQLWGVDFRKSAAHLGVPVYFLIGRYDVNAPPSLTEDYYKLLQAPHKELIWFEHSGHGPWVTESDRFADVVVNKVLPETQARANEW